MGGGLFKQVIHAEFEIIFSTASSYYPVALLCDTIKNDDDEDNNDDETTMYSISVSLTQQRAVTTSLQNDKDSPQCHQQSLWYYLKFESWILTRTASMGQLLVTYSYTIFERSSSYSI